MTERLLTIQRQSDIDAKKLKLYLNCEVSIIIWSIFIVKGNLASRFLKRPIKYRLALSETRADYVGL